MKSSDARRPSEPRRLLEEARPLVTARPFHPAVRTRPPGPRNREGGVLPSNRPIDFEMGFRKTLSGGEIDDCATRSPRLILISPSDSSLRCPNWCAQRPVPKSHEVLRVMRHIENLHVGHPFQGSRRMTIALGTNHRACLRLMQLSDIEAAGISRPTARKISGLLFEPTAVPPSPRTVPHSLPEPRSVAFRGFRALRSSRLSGWRGSGGSCPWPK